jgi:hypothetical protein
MHLVPAGDSLSASTSGSGVVAVNAPSEDVGLGPARVKRADALFSWDDGL